MKSRASFCNGSLLKSNLRRYWLFPALFGLFCLLSLSLLPHRFPLLFSEYMDHEERVRCMLEDSAMLGVFFMFPAAFMAAALPFSYLHKRGSAYMYHALPFSRGSLFGTSLVTGLIFGLFPVVLTVLINFLSVTFSASLTLKGLAGAVLLSALAVTLAFLLFYGLAVFSMQLTGRTFAAIGVYLLLNFGAVAVEGLTQVLLSPYLHGIEQRYFTLAVLSPVCRLAENSVSSAFDLLPLLGIYAGAGAVFAVLGRLLYRHRRIESAGDTIAYKSAGFILKYIVTYVTGVAFGILLALLFGVDADNAAGGLILCVLIGSALTFILSEMILKRTVKVFRPKLLLGYLAFAGVLLLTVFCAKIDLFGAVRYVPDASDVASVTLMPDYYNDARTVTLTDPEGISAVTGLHRQLTENKPGTHGAYVNITYKLKSGKTVERTYSGDFDIDSAQLRGVLDNPERLKAEFLSRMEKAKHFSCNGADLDAEKFREAYLADIAEGNIRDSGWFFADGEYIGTEYYVDWATADYEARNSLDIPAAAKRTIAYLISAGADDWKNMPPEPEEFAEYTEITEPEGGWPER